MLKGRKSYIIMIATLAFAWGGFFAGMHDVNTAITLTLGAGGLGALRAGVAEKNNES